MTPEERIDALQKLDAVQTALIAIATNDEGETEAYPQLRRELLTHPILSEMMPDFVRRYPDLRQFWPFIKRKYGTYGERREFIWNEFAKVVTFVEGLEPGAPGDPNVSEMLKEFDEAYIYAVWQKAIQRRTSDPEGAITSARTLLETVCKRILDEKAIGYEDDMSLPGLYKLVAQQLNLAPDQHTEKVFKQILGGCQTVVEGLGSVRNKLSDAHGKGKKAARPMARHAQLAVNLAGAMATFLVSTWRERTAEPIGPARGGAPFPDVRRR
jgi:hypothetical protein